MDRHEHRSLRMGKLVGPQGSNSHTLNHTFTQYDESRQPLAELDQHGRITRQTVWLADMPLVVIDSPAGQALAGDTAGLAQVWADLGRMVQSWFSPHAAKAGLAVRLGLRLSPHGRRTQHP